MFPIKDFGAAKFGTTTITPSQRKNTIVDKHQRQKERKRHEISHPSLTASHRTSAASAVTRLGKNPAKSQGDLTFSMNA